MRALLLAALLLVPAAAAHVSFTRPGLQATEEKRVVESEIAGVNATWELLLQRDPVSHHVRHVVDPRRGVVSVEYRPQLPQADAAFVARWEIERILEYRDQNVDGLYSPPSDTVVRGWRFESYPWAAVGPQVVRIATLPGDYVRWTANTSGGPSVRIEAIATGAAYVDEGATVREQDLALFVDVRDFPRRGTGNLHAIEGLLRASEGASARVLLAENRTVAYVVESEGRFAMLDVGGEALIDDREQAVTLQLGERQPDGAVPFRISLPLLERSARFVMVSAVEYRNENPRESPGLGTLGSLAALTLVALAVRRR